MMQHLFFDTITTQNGQTPVHKACKGKDSKERSKLLQYLIEKGANIDLQSRVIQCNMAFEIIIIM